ncbi:hypothetical protein FB451DRAFT_1255537 [Mycena latifolia]|nr:hypothetical protein FB451DRAFT_1255537 [Mycena latifolia]
MVSFLRTQGWALFIFSGILAALAGPEFASSSWRKPEVTLSSAERVALANAALDQSISVISTTAALRATVFSQMAEFDIVTNQTTNGDALQDYLSAATTSKVALAQPESIGHAAIRAYVTYKNPVFLDFANTSWAFARSYTISADDIASSSVLGKDFKLETACQGASMLGGTFDTSNSTDPSITGFASTLSALLAEATSDPLYLNAALDSADFISAQLASTQNLIQDGISASQDDACAVDSTENSFNTGLMIEGLSVLCSVTSNASTQALLNEVIIATISNDAWQTTEGIIARGASKFGDKYIVRGLATAYTRNTTAPDLRTYVHDYLGVQFNAVIDLATSSGSGIYGGAWTGPPSAVFSQSNQTTAISALMGGILLPPPDGGPATGSVPTSSAPAPSGSSSVPVSKHGRRPAPAVVAGALVGSVAVLAIGVGMWFILRRRARAARPISFAPTMMAAAPTPEALVSRSSTFVSLSSQALPRTSLDKPALSAPETAAPDEPGGETTAHEQPSIPAPSQQANDQPVYDPLAQSPPDDRTSRALLSATASAPVAPPDAGSPMSPDHLPTTELVRLLNERLRHRQWDEEESPPEYGAERDP